MAGILSTLEGEQEYHGLKSLKVNSNVLKIFLHPPSLAISYIAWLDTYKAMPDNYR